MAKRNSNASLIADYEEQIRRYSIQAGNREDEICRLRAALKHEKDRVAVLEDLLADENDGK